MAQISEFFTAPKNLLLPVGCCPSSLVSEICSEDGSTLFALASDDAVCSILVLDTRQVRILKQFLLPFDPKSVMIDQLIPSGKSKEFLLVSRYRINSTTWGWSLHRLTLKGMERGYSSDEKDATLDITLLVSSDQLSKQSSAGALPLDFGGYFFHASLDESKEVVRLVSAPYDWRIYEVNLKDLTCDCHRIHPERSLPWIFEFGHTLWQNRLFVTVACTDGMESMPEKVVMVDLEQKVMHFIPCSGDPAEGYPTARLLHGCIGKNGFMYIFGGLKLKGDPLFCRPMNEVLEDMWQLDLTSMEWKKLRDRAPSGSQQATVSPSGTVISIWKDDSENVRLAKCFVGVAPLSELAWIRILKDFSSILQLNSAQQRLIGIPPSFRL